MIYFAELNVSILMEVGSEECVSQIAYDHHVMDYSDNWSSTSFDKDSHEHFGGRSQYWYDPDFRTTDAGYEYLYMGIREMNIDQTDNVTGWKDLYLENRSEMKLVNEVEECYVIL